MTTDIRVIALSLDAIANDPVNSSANVRLLIRDLANVRVNVGEIVADFIHDRVSTNAHELALAIAPALVDVKDLVDDLVDDLANGCSSIAEVDLEVALINARALSRELVAAYGFARSTVFICIYYDLVRACHLANDITRKLSNVNVGSQHE